MLEKVVLVLGILGCVAGGVEPARGQAQRGFSSISLVLSHVAIVDVVAGRMEPDMTVIVANAHIKAIGPSGKISTPNNATVVDARGKFLIPGLWDSHIHLRAHNSPKDWAREVSLPLLVANGITGVRDMGAPMGLIKDLRREIEAGSIPGPRIVASGEVIEDSDLDDARARRAVKSLKISGADFVKVFSWVPRSAFFAVADEARKQDISFVGHVPELVSAEEASDAGQRSMEHTMGIWQSCSTAETELRKSMSEAMRDPKTAPQYIFNRVDFGLPPRGTLNTFSADKASRLFGRFVRNGTWQVPTIVEEQSFALHVSGRLMDQRGMNLIPPLMQKPWDLTNILTPLSAEDRQDLVKFVPMILDAVGLMHRVGVRILAGSDAPWLVVPGFSLHDELILLTRAGLTPAEALRAATIDPAQFLGLQGSLGTVETGKLADLVILDANPLQDIRNTQKIRGVLMQGRYFDRQHLDRLLKKVAAEQTIERRSH